MKHIISLIGEMIVYIALNNKICYHVPYLKYISNDKKYCDNLLI